MFPTAVFSLTLLPAKIIAPSITTKNCLTLSSPSAEFQNPIWWEVLLSVPAISFKVWEYLFNKQLLKYKTSFERVRPTGYVQCHVSIRLLCCNISVWDRKPITCFYFAGKVTERSEHKSDMAHACIQFPDGVLNTKSAGGQWKMMQFQHLFLTA